MENIQNLEKRPCGDEPRGPTADPQLQFPGSWEDGTVAESPLEPEDRVRTGSAQTTCSSQARNDAVLTNRPFGWVNDITLTTSKLARIPQYNTSRSKNSRDPSNLFPPSPPVMYRPPSSGHSNDLEVHKSAMSPLPATRQEPAAKSPPHHTIHIMQTTPISRRNEHSVVRLLPHPTSVAQRPKPNPYECMSCRSSIARQRAPETEVSGCLGPRP